MANPLGLSSQKREELALLNGLTPEQFDATVNAEMQSNTATDFLADVKVIPQRSTDENSCTSCNEKHAKYLVELDGHWFPADTSFTTPGCLRVNVATVERQGMKIKLWHSETLLNSKNQPDEKK